MIPDTTYDPGPKDRLSGLRDQAALLRVVIAACELSHVIGASGAVYRLSRDKFYHCRTYLQVPTTIRSIIYMYILDLFVALRVMLYRGAVSRASRIFLYG